MPLMISYLGVDLHLERKDINALDISYRPLAQRASREDAKTVCARCRVPDRRRSICYDGSMRGRLIECLGRMETFSHGNTAATLIN